MARHQRRRASAYSTDYERGCTGKKQLRSRNEARAARTRLMKQPDFVDAGRPVDIYRCRVCKFFHVGTRPMNGRPWEANEGQGPPVSDG